MVNPIIGGVRVTDTDPLRVSNIRGDGTTKKAVIDISASGDNTVVAAVAAKKLVVTSICLIAAGTVTLTVKSGAAGTAITGPLPLAVNTGFSSGFDPAGHFQTAAGALLNLSLSAAVAVGGWLTYIEVE